MRFQPFLGFCFPCGNSLPGVQSWGALWQEAIYHREPPKEGSCHLRLTPLRLSSELGARGFSGHDAAEFLETDLGKRKLTYVGVTMSVSFSDTPSSMVFFFPKKRKMLKLLVGVEIQLEIFWGRVKVYLTLGAYLCGLLPGLVYIPSRVPCSPLLFSL